MYSTLPTLCTCASEYFDFRDLMNIIKEEGQKLINAQSSETTVGNMVRRGKEVFRTLPNDSCKYSYTKDAVFSVMLY